MKDYRGPSIDRLIRVDSVIQGLWNIIICEKYHLGMEQQDYAALADSTMNIAREIVFATDNSSIEKFEDVYSRNMEIIKSILPRYGFPSEQLDNEDYLASRGSEEECQKVKAETRQWVLEKFGPLGILSASLTTEVMKKNLNKEIRRRRISKN